MHEVNLEVSREIHADLTSRGLFYHEGEDTFIFLSDEKALVRIHPDDTDFSLLMGGYGINRTEALFNFVAEHLHSGCLQNGTETKVHRLAYYKADRHTLYVFDFNNQIYRITPEKVELVDNGTDGVLFLLPPEPQPFEAETEKGKNSSSLLETTILERIHFAESALSADEQRLVFRIWFLSLFFESIMPTKPILALIGEKGSGKSITLRMVGKLLFGEGFDVTPLPGSAGDFDVAAANSAFLAIDNADTGCGWLDDKLATIATGGTIKKRVLYTDSKMIEIRPRCFIAITSRTPQFRRDDVADRLLLLHVERFKEFIPERTILDEVLRNRDRLMGEVIQQLQSVVRALKESTGEPYKGKFRMADFAGLAMKVAGIFGKRDEMTRILDKMSRAQTMFALEEDPIFRLLQIWAEENPGREVTNAELLQELDRIAEERELPFPAYQTRAFAQRMSALRPRLEPFFDITERSAGGHTKKYRFIAKERTG